MKVIFGIVVVSCIWFNVSAQDGFKPLFNGKNFDGWQSARELTESGSSCFTVNAEGKVIHVYAGKADSSEQFLDCLFTEKEYSNYILTFEYKWLNKRFAPRVDFDRDAGALFHIHGDLSKIWPDCVEMQMGESEASKLVNRFTTGDLWVIGNDVQVMNERNEKSFYTPGAGLVTVGENVPFDMSLITEDNEKPHGKWNKIVLTVRGGKEAIFELNGKVVNRIANMTYIVDGKRVPLEKGRIGFQAEYAELLYRKIQIKELPAL